MANELATKEAEPVLMNYDVACRQLARVLAQAKNVKEVKQIHGLAGALKVYAKLAGDKKAAADAWEIRQTSERTLGIMMANGRDDRAPVGRPTEKPKEKMGSEENPFPTLAEIGIGKGLANRSRRLAALSEKDYGLYLIDGRADVEHAAERSPQLKAKPKKKPKKQREFDCPYCGKTVYLKDGKLEK